MYNSYYLSSRIDKMVITESRVDVVAYTKKKMALDLVDKIMDDKEIDLNKVAIRIQFAEFDVRENEGMYPMNFAYKEIQARLRVIPYA